MELPVDPLVLRAVSFLHSKTPDSARELYDMMRDHNHLSASLVDVWLGKDCPRGPPRPAGAIKSTGTSTSSLSSADDERPMAVPSSLQLSRTTAKKDGRNAATAAATGGRARSELFTPDPAPAAGRRDLKSPPPPPTGHSPVDGAPARAYDVAGGGAAPEASDSALFSVPDNVRKRPLDVTNRLKVAPRALPKGLAPRAGQGRPAPLKDAGATAAGARNAGGGGGRSKTPLLPSPSRAPCEEDVAVSVSPSPSSSSTSSSSTSEGSLPPCRWAANDVEKKPTMAVNGAGSVSSGGAVSVSSGGAVSSVLDSSTSEDDLTPGHPSADRSAKGRKRGHAVISSDEDVSDAFSDDNGSSVVSAAWRQAQPPRKCKPPPSHPFDGIELSDDDDDDDSSLSLPTSPMNGNATPLASTPLPVPSVRSGSSTGIRPPPSLKIPLKPVSASSRSGGAQTPDTPNRTGLATTPTGGSRPGFSTQLSRSSTSGSGGGRHLSSSGSANRNFEGLKKQAKKMSQVRALRK